jgi:hypothetical protein
LTRSSAPLIEGFTTSRRYVPATPTSYSDFVRDLTRQGNYVPLSRHVCQVFGLDAAAVLLNVLNAAQLRSDEEGWQQVTPAWLCRGLGISEQRANIAVNLLLEKGVVEVKNRGGSRHLRINLYELQRQLREETT